MIRLLLSISCLIILAVPAQSADPVQVASAGNATTAISGGEWPQWRGPNRDAISTETGLLQDWPDDGPPLLWRTDGLGSGYASVAIADGKLFTMGSRDKSTYLIALDLNDQSELWATRVGAGSPNCTPTVDGNLVFALGFEGDLLCADANSGKALWRKSFPKDLGGKMMSGWGYSESPLVDGDRLVCTPGAPKAMIVALDKNTGKVIWRADTPKDLGPQGKEGAGYSSIIVSEAGGIRQYIQLTGRGLVSVAADDGRFLWSYNRIANRTANIPTPIVDGDYIFCSTGYQTGAALVKVVANGKSLEAEEVYFLDSRTLQNHHGGMVLIDGYVYCGHGHNNGMPVCIDMKTGKIAWGPERGPGAGSAAVLYADGNLYFRYENGVMALIDANPDKYELKSSFRIASNNGKSWPHPVIADGRLYLRDQDELLCYDISQHTASAAR